MSSSARLSGRLVTVDMLRGLAALAVLVYHARAMLWCGTSHLLSEHGVSASPNVLAAYALTMFRFGWLGVPLFFVLSGYCIHRSHARRLRIDSTVAINWRWYALRRFWRIYPVYLGALVLTAITDSYTRSFAPQWYSENWDLSLFSFLSSVLSLQGITALQFGSNGVFWTLSVELHFYVAYPLLLFLSRRSPRYALLFALLTSLVFISLDHIIGINDMFPYRSSNGGPLFVSYWVTWAVGMYLADVEAGRERIPRFAMRLWLPMGILGLILSTLRITDVAWLCWGYFFAGILLTLNRLPPSSVWVGKVSSFFASVGIFSYSLYATHLCVLIVVGSLIVNPAAKPMSLLPCLLAVILSVGFAWIFFQVVERWSLRVPGVGRASGSEKSSEIGPLGGSGGPSREIDCFVPETRVSAKRS